MKELTLCTSSRSWLRGLSSYSKLRRRSGSRACRMWFLSHRILSNKLSSTSSTSSAAVGISERHSPERTPRRITASTRCRSAAVAKPHQALAAYVSLATTTHRKTVCVSDCVADRLLLPWETFTSILVSLCLFVLELGAVRDRRANGWTDEQMTGVLRPIIRSHDKIRYDTMNDLHWKTGRQAFSLI